MQKVLLLEIKKPKSSKTRSSKKKKKRKIQKNYGHFGRKENFSTLPEVFSAPFLLPGGLSCSECFTAPKLFVRLEKNLDTQKFEVLCWVENSFLLLKVLGLPGLIRER